MAEKVSRRLVILSATAIAAVYAAGFQETRAADARLAGAAIPVSTAAGTAGLGSAIAVAPAPATSTSPTGEAASSAATISAPTNAGSSGIATARPSATDTMSAVPTTAATAVPTAMPTTGPATAVKTAATAMSTPSSTGFKDGAYQGAGTSRRGGIGVAVTVQNGRVTRVAITQSTTQYPVSRIAGLPSEVVARQTAQVDLVSGATFSSLAFQGAVQQALVEAKSA